MVANYSTNASAGVHLTLALTFPDLSQPESIGGTVEPHRVCASTIRPSPRPIRLVLPGNRCDPLSGQIAE